MLSLKAATSLDEFQTDRSSRLEAAPNSSHCIHLSNTLKLEREFALKRDVEGIWFRGKSVSHRHQCVLKHRHIENRSPFAGMD